MPDRYMLLLVEESDSSLGFYDSASGAEAGRVALGLWPHEIAVSPDGNTAYVTNFGLRDYDLSLGHAGNSISVIDIATRCETDRLYTCTGDFKYWGPHGVKVSPDGARLYVNVERVIGTREQDPDAGPGAEQTKMLVYELESRRVIQSFALPSIAEEIGEGQFAFDVPRGSHNFVFSPDGKHLWIFSGRGGITRLNPDTGEATAHLRDFNGSVRGLAFTSNGRLLVSATNEVSLLDPESLTITQRIGNLGVGQILYSKATPDVKHVLAPAVWEGQILVIDLATESVVDRIVTGIDPVQVMIAPDGMSAFVTHGRSLWTSEIDLGTFKEVRRIATQSAPVDTAVFRERRRIATQGGPNGAAFAPWTEPPTKGTITFGACLPFSGEYSVEGRELRLGLQHWQDKVNASGGILVDGQPLKVDIVYSDTHSRKDSEYLTELTERLVKESSPQFLFGTYPPEANLPVAHVSNALGLPFLTSTGTDPDLYTHKMDFVFSLVGPNEGSLIGVIAAIRRNLSPKPQTLAILSCDQPTTLKDAILTAQYAKQKGMSLVASAAPGFPSGPSGVMVYPHGTTDFTRAIAAIQEQEPDIFLHAGHRSEALAIIRASKSYRFSPGALGFNFGITIAGFRSSLGDSAQNLFGNVPWSDHLVNCAHDRFVAAEDFARSYFDEYSEAASYLAAGAAGCGVVYEEAVRNAGTVQPDRVRISLSTLKLGTFFGDVAFNVKGYNERAVVVTVQLQKVVSQIVDVPVWPPSVAHPNSLKWPFAGWPEES